MKNSNNRNIVIVLSSIVLLLVIISIVLILKISSNNNPTPSAVLGLTTTKLDCSSFLSTSLLQSLKNNPDYSALSQVGWTLFSTKDLSDNDGSYHCLYTFLGNVQLEMTIYKPITNTGQTNQGVINYLQIVDSNIKPIVSIGLKDDTPPDFYRYFFGHDISDQTKCRMNIFDQNSRFSYIDVKYPITMACDDSKSIDLNKALFKALTLSLIKITNT